MAQAALAQTQTAYVSSATILEQLPAAQTARATLAELQTSWMRDVKRQETEISTLRQQIESNRLLWSSQEKRDADARLRDLENRLLTFQAERFGPGGEYEKQHDQLMGPVMDRVLSAIAEEAQAQGYDFVFDKSTRGLPMLFASPEHDLTNSVLKRLGVDVEEAAAPPTAAEGEEAEDEARGNRRRRGRGRGEGGGADPNQELKPGDER